MPNGLAARISLVRKLGKLPPRRDRRTLKLANYLTVEKPPRAIDWHKAVQKPWGMLGNDVACDCVFAAALHQIQLWKANAGQQISFTDEQALNLYALITGYVRGDDATDQGAVELDSLNLWRQSGFLGDKIEAFVSVNLKRLNEVKLAIAIFGGIFQGFSLPMSADAQFGNGQPWTPVRGPDGRPGSLGGHAVMAGKYEPDGPRTMFHCITWGKDQPFSDRFFAQCDDEAYAIVSKDWLNAQGKSPTGLDLAALLKDLAKVTA